MDPWLTHQWLNPHGRTLKLNGQWKREYYCLRCKRHFVEFVESQKRYAAYPSALDFDPLAQNVSERWLAEACPGQEQPEDFIEYRSRPQAHR